QRSHPVDLPVDLRRPDANAARIQRGVGAPRDDEAAVIGTRQPVTVAPHTWIDAEVGSVERRPVAVSPQPERHRRKRGRADQLAHLTDRWWYAVCVEDINRHTECGPLNLTCIHGPRRIADNETAADVGAA